jgi:creatinine amidohydrolase
VLARTTILAATAALAIAAGCRPGGTTEVTGDAGRGADRGVLLEDLTWLEAEKALRPETVVVIPLGASSKEHGPHLKLKNDWLLAEYFKKRVLAAADVVVAPTIGHHYYPAFVEYPGSISLRLETARDLVIDTVRSLARFGPRRFYVLNTGVSTGKARASSSSTRSSSRRSARSRRRSPSRPAAATPTRSRPR